VLVLLPFHKKMSLLTSYCTSALGIHAVATFIGQDIARLISNVGSRTAATSITSARVLSNLNRANLITGIVAKATPVINLGVISKQTGLVTNTTIITNRGVFRSVTGIRTMATPLSNCEARSKITGIILFATVSTNDGIRSYVTSSLTQATPMTN
jgi:hypothetical protein